MIIGFLIGIGFGVFYYAYKEYLYRKDQKELEKIDTSNMQVLDFHKGANRLTNYLFLICGIALVMALLAKDGNTISLIVGIIGVGVVERIYAKKNMVFYYDDEKCVIANTIVKYKHIKRCEYVRKLFIEQGCVYLYNGGGYYVYKQAIPRITYQMKKNGYKVEEPKE